MPQDVYPDAGLTTGEDDLAVTPEQILALRFFPGVNEGKLRRCQGAMVLRTFKETGQLICRQGAAGASAYFILSEADVYGLYDYLETKLQTAQAKLQTASAASKPTDKLKAHVQKLLTIRDTYRAKLLFLGDDKRMAKLRTAHEANLAVAQRCRTSPEERHLLTASGKDKRTHAEKVKEIDPALAAHLLAAADGQDDRPAASVFRHALGESAGAVAFATDGASSRQVTMYERELFGEMACKNRKPRAADVRAARPIYVLELLSNVLAILTEEGQPFKQELQKTYDQRVLELHLRDLSLFRHLPEDQFMATYDRIRTRLSVVSKKPGEIICAEGDNADVVFLIRQGWVQVKVQRGSPQQILAYRGPGEFIGEMALIRTAEQSAALRKADFTGVLQAMPQPGPRTATCVAFGHPDGKGEVELLRIPYEEFWELIKASAGIREEIVNEVERRRKEPHGLPVVPDVKGSANVLFAENLVPLGLYQGQSLMLIDLDRCTRCDECVKACVDTHRDGRSRLFLSGPRAYIGERTFLVPTTCQSCEDPVCMIGCPTRAIRRGDKGEMTIDEKSCIGCEGCARKCPYNAIQMHDLALIPGQGLKPNLKPAPSFLHPRGAGDKARAPCDGWYCFPATEISDKMSAWRARTSPPRGWLACESPFHFDRGFREGLAAAAQRSGGSVAILPDEMLCLWRTFPVSLSLGDWDGQLVLEVESAPDSFKVWIDGREIEPDKKDAFERTYEFKLPVSASKGWRWWRKEDTHVLALQVIPKCAPWAKFLEVRLDVVRPPRGPWDILDEFTEKQRQPRLAVVCDLCHTLSGGPACIRACPHDATRRLDARRGLDDW